MANTRYLLISSCRNEGAYIDGLVDAIAAQTLPPMRWIIVDDGSSDDTYVRCHARAKNLPFLDVAKMPGGRPRTFSSKVFALQHACEEVKNIEAEFVGVVDADIRVEPTYYERLIELMKTDSRLGLGGGTVLEQSGQEYVNTRKGSEDFHVPGGVHFFRRECFDQVGGYVPIDAGGEDTIAEVTAMMHGWKVRAFGELTALHLRPEGVGNSNVFVRGMKWGRRFYLLGYHPLFYFFHCVRRLGWRPVLIDSGCRFLGFLVAAVRAEARPVSKEFVRFQRRMQMQRLRGMLTGACGETSFSAEGVVRL
jgi:glycosyltransferase involved in cell wall biosynthesis